MGDASKCPAPVSPGYVRLRHEFETYWRHTLPGSCSLPTERFPSSSPSSYEQHSLAAFSPKTQLYTQKTLLIVIPSAYFGQMRRFLKWRLERVEIAVQSFGETRCFGLSCTSFQRECTLLCRCRGFSWVIIRLYITLSFERLPTCEESRGLKWNRTKRTCAHKQCKSVLESSEAQISFRSV